MPKIIILNNKNVKILNKLSVSIYGSRRIVLFMYVEFYEVKSLHKRGYPQKS